MEGHAHGFEPGGNDGPELSLEEIRKLSGPHGEMYKVVGTVLWAYGEAFKEQMVWLDTPVWPEIGSRAFGFGFDDHARSPRDTYCNEVRKVDLFGREDGTAIIVARVEGDGSSRIRDDGPKPH